MEADWMKQADMKEKERKEYVKRKTKQRNHWMLWKETEWNKQTWKKNKEKNTSREKRNKEIIGCHGRRLNETSRHERKSKESVVVFR